MKIGVFDGSVTFGLGTVHPQLDRKSFLATELGRNAKTRLVSSEWWHMSVEPEDGLAATVLFRGNRLIRVLILMKIKSDDAGKWTVEHELERKSVHDSWLRAELGKPPYQYSWGDVASEFDQKGCVSEIIVSYAE